MAGAWLFPGQGTQKVGMGKAVAEAFPEARSVFEEADDALGFSLSKLCFEGPQEDLTLTANTQPAILTTSIATLTALRAATSIPLVPTFAAGHSLGEYSALVASGALRFADAVRLVRLRGQAMQESVPAGHGAMAAIVGGDPDSVSQLCVDASLPGEPVSPANFNAPGQIVIAGASKAVERAAKLASERKLKAIPLQVSAPFHCSLMEPAARAVETALRDITIGDMVCPVVANFDARPNQQSNRVAELLVKQIDNPVRWEGSVTWMSQNGVTDALEIGEGKVLAGLVRKIDKAIQVVGVSTPEDIEKLVASL